MSSNLPHSLPWLFLSVCAQNWLCFQEDFSWLLSKSDYLHKIFLTVSHSICFLVTSFFFNVYPPRSSLIFTLRHGVFHLATNGVSSLRQIGSALHPYGQALFMANLLDHLTVSGIANYFSDWCSHSLCRYWGEIQAHALGLLLHVKTPYDWFMTWAIRVTVNSAWSNKCRKSTIWNVEETSRHFSIIAKNIVFVIQSWEKMINAFSLLPLRGNGSTDINLE